MSSLDIAFMQNKYGIIGRAAELQQALYAINAKKNVLIDGTVGVGKTVIAVALASHFGRNIYRVDGDERYTEQKMVGWFDPPHVMAKGYSNEAFIEGPLIRAMREGAFLFINELNRMPEGTQNVLLPAMDERKVVIPRIGTVEAKEGFTIIATQNPEEYIGTSRLSEALKDRFVWIRLDYQSEDEEAAIVKKETRSNDEVLVKIAVKIGRKTRQDSEIRRGASVRGAIDLVAVVQQASANPITELAPAEAERLLKMAAIMALSSKVELREGSHEKLVETLSKVVEAVLKELRLNAPVTQEAKEHSENF